MKVFVSEEEAKLHKVSINRMDDIVIIRCNTKKVARKMKELVKTLLVAQSDVEEEEEDLDIDESKTVIGFKG